MRKVLLFACIAILAGALQSQVSDRLSIFGCSPDFLIAATMAMGFILDPVLGGAFGLIAGMVQASTVGASFGGFIISRTLLGFLSASLRAWVFQENPIVLMAAALLGTVFTEGVYFLIDPSRNSSVVLSHLPMESVYNAVLAVICYMLIRRAMEQERDKQAFGRVD